MICPPHHTHGTKTTCYVQHRCRCNDCFVTMRAYRAKSKKPLRKNRKKLDYDYIISEMKYFRSLGDSAYTVLQMFKHLGLDERLPKQLIRMGEFELLEWLENDLSTIS